ncbi:MAG: hypothetical protein ABMA01_04110 [Chthoniobacteraceae bacterium]
MKISKYITALAAACSLLCLATPASAVIVNVAGTANPWAAFGPAPDGGTAPTFIGGLAAGDNITFTASGLVNWGFPVGGPGVGPAGAAPQVSHGAAGGVTALNNVNQSSLIGVWSNGVAFVMGASGGFVVPAGVSSLSLGTMDNGNWSDNTGSFSVDYTKTASGVPDFGSTLSLMVIGLGLMFAYRKHVLA